MSLRKIVEAAAVFKTEVEKLQALQIRKQAIQNEIADLNAEIAAQQPNVDAAKSALLEAVNE